ncbi:MAG: T9SS type A sorting domain-containing protein [Calditrichaeota bacterium]|nr:T9SS type A sorting domain-containing protein [Calditrichota bacterium]
MFKKLPFFVLLALLIGFNFATAQEPWVYQNKMDIKFSTPDSSTYPFLCTTDNRGNLWVITSSAVDVRGINALWMAAPGDTVFTLIDDYTTNLDVESTRGITAIDDTILVICRKPGTPMPSLSIMYEYPDGDPAQRKEYTAGGYGTWVLGLSATKDKFVYSGLSYHTSIRVYDFTDTSSTRGTWVPIQPLDLHPIEPGGHDGTGFSIIRDVAVIPGADYSDPSTPFYSSRNSDTLSSTGGIAVWTGGTQTSPKDYSGQRVTDVSSYLSWLSWTPYGIACDSEGNLWACGTDTTRRWVKSFMVSGNFAIELEELPSANSSVNPVPEGAPMLAPSDIAFSPDEKIAYVIDQEAKRAFVFSRGPLQAIDDPRQLTVPETSQLLGNYPNPFNSQTIVEYQLNRAQPVEIRIFNNSGQLVQSLHLGTQSAGRHKVTINADNWASGVYFYQWKTEDAIQVRKMLLIK